MKGNLKLDHTVKANANQEEKVGFIAHKKTAQTTSNITAKCVKRRRNTITFQGQSLV